MSAENVRYIHDLIGAFDAAHLYDDDALMRKHVDSIILALGDEHDHWMTMSHLLDSILAARKDASS